MQAESMIFSKREGVELFSIDIGSYLQILTSIYVKA